MPGEKRKLSSERKPRPPPQPEPDHLAMLTTDGVNLYARTDDDKEKLRFVRNHMRQCKEPIPKYELDLPYKAELKEMPTITKQEAEELMATKLFVSNGRQEELLILNTQRQIDNWSHSPEFEAFLDNVKKFQFGTVDTEGDPHAKDPNANKGDTLLLGDYKGQAGGSPREY